MTQDADSLPLWILPAIPFFFICLWCAVCYLMAFISGWQRLAAHYAATTVPEGTQFLFRGGTIGLISYRGCLQFAASADGLFIWLFLPFRLGHPRLFIPWNDIGPSAQKVWMFDYAVLSFAQAPGVRMRLLRRIADEIAAASGGALRIGAA